MNAAASGSGGIAPDKIRATMFAFALALAALVTAAGFLAATVGPVEALPSYARQTGQPCAACHTAFPELTPFGRRFKIGGYTLGGGDWKGPPIAAMYMAGFTHTQSPQDAPPAPGLHTNDNLVSQQVSGLYRRPAFRQSRLVHPDYWRSRWRNGRGGRLRRALRRHP